MTLFSPTSHLKGFPVTSLRFTEFLIYRDIMEVGGSEAPTCLKLKGFSHNFFCTVISKTWPR